MIGMYFILSNAQGLSVLVGLLLTKLNNYCNVSVDANMCFGHSKLSNTKHRRHCPLRKAESPGPIRDV